MTRAAASCGLPVQHVEADRVSQREIAAARPHERGEMPAGSQPFAERVGQRPHVIAGRADQPQAQLVPRHSMTSSAVAVTCDGLERHRRVPARKVVGAIAVDFLRRKAGGCCR